MTDQTRWGIDLVQQENKSKVHAEQKEMREEVKAWKRYGVEVELVAPNLSKIIKLGTSHGEKYVDYKKKKKNHIVNIFG